MVAASSVENSSSPEQTVRHVLTRYGFAPSSIEHVEALPRRISNTNFRVRAGDRDWVVKSHTSMRVLRRLALAHPLELRLADAGFPVAQIQRSEAGQTLVEAAGVHYSLHSWIHGQQIAIADRERVLTQHPHVLTDLASAIGTLHRVAGALEHSGEDPPAVLARDLLSSPRRTARNIKRVRPLRVPRWHALRLKRPKSEFDQWILQAMPEVVAHAGRLAGQAKVVPVESADIIVSHHDVNWENLIFDEDFRLRALLDFDNAIRAPRAIEVGSAAVVLAGAERGRLDTFLTTYEGTAEVQMDHDIVELGMAMKCVQSILNSINTYLNGNVADTQLLSSWCYHLHESLQELSR